MIFEILFILFLKQVNCLVCNKTISVLREVPITYQYTYYEAYESEDCLLIWCTKSRLAVNVGTKLVTKPVDEVEMKCCDGYIEDIDYHGDGIQCFPKCTPPCINGFCRKPNECACEWGFGLDPVAPNTCRPLCLDGCDLPDCLPTCNQDTSAIDTCHETCELGTCINGQCQCQSGHTLSNGTCEPIRSCNHGTCIAPGICECESDFSSKCEVCPPVCTGCEHGTCTAPGHCVCHTGYKEEYGKCEPLCRNCNGTCIAPDVCVCDPGWYMNEDRTECLAHCDVTCGNGSCISPNVCECHPGYMLNQNDKGPQCVPVCDNCDGVCTAPDVCECEDHYQTIYTTEDGGACDCFDCDNINRKCKRTICRKVIDTDVEARNINNELIAANNEQPLEVIPATLMNPMGQKNGSRNDETFPWMFSEPDEFTYHWIYGTIIIVELVVIVILLAFFNRKHILNRLKTKKFIPQGKPDEEITVQYTNTPT